MNVLDRLQRRTIIIGIALIPLTAVSLYLIYGSYLFSKWPWIRFSVGMATLTCLWAYTFCFTRTVETYDTLSFVLIVIPFDSLLMYPGLEELGIYSDPKMYTMLIILGLTHGFGFYLIQRQIKNYLIDSKSR